MAQKPKLRKLILDTFYQLGGFDLIHRKNQNHLTVLNYHRINNPDTPGFDTFKPNVSATPKQFDAQMAYVSDRYHLITTKELINWVYEGSPLPPHAAMVSFDDGYQDNLT